MKRTAISLFCFMLALIVLSACAKPMTDEEKVAKVVEITNPSIEQMNQTLGDTMKIELSARGSALIYAFKYLQEMPDTAAMKEGLDAQKGTLESSMTPLLTQLKDAGIDNPEVVVEYLNKDGGLITSFSFK